MLFTVGLFIDGGCTAEILAVDIAALVTVLLLLLDDNDVT